MAVLGPLDRRNLRKRCLACARRKTKVRSSSHQLFLRLELMHGSVKEGRRVFTASRRSSNAYHKLLFRQVPPSSSMPVLYPWQEHRPRIKSYFKKSQQAISLARDCLQMFHPRSQLSSQGISLRGSWLQMILAGLSTWTRSFPSSKVCRLYTTHLSLSGRFISGTTYPNCMWVGRQQECVH